MKKILLILFLIIIATVVGLAIYFNILINSQGTGDEKDFVVKSGQSTRTIAENLEKENLIRSATAFTYYAKFRAELIQIGVYRLSRTQNIKEILETLASSKNSQDSLTVPEGYRATQIDELLASKGIISKGSFLQIASSNEGYLFPDTYRFLPKTKPETIRDEMLSNFEEKTAGQNVTRDNIILASIVEREAKFDEDRAKIAGVYLNRLAIDMRLEADPTIQYGKGSWDPIKYADYKGFNSPYNTYLNAGLPPGPICNPGLKSIEAVLKPDQKDNYLFFFHKDDGHAVYSKTAAEHADNLKKK